MTSQGTIAVAPATAQLAALRSGELSSGELLENFLERITTYDGDLNAVVTIDEEGGRRAAAAADRSRAAGEPLGPLHGLPITIKDAIEVAGLRSTGGARELAGHVPDRDAPAVSRLRAAGAVIFGKTNVPEWSADIQTSNQLFGTTNNPWDATRTPGGSSGGSAVAVACGFTGLELGTDIGGSIRIPSHFCGTFGLKPTYGVISQRGYLDRVGGSTADRDINVFGPLARSADDLALALAVLAGPDGAQPGRRLNPPAGEPRRVPGRVGVWLDEPSCPVDTAVRRLLSVAATRLSEDGWVVEEDHPPVSFPRQARLAQRLIGAAVSGGSNAGSGSGSGVGVGVGIGGVSGGAHRARSLARAERKAFEAVWREWFGRFDALLCPVFGVPAFEHDTGRPLMERVVDVDGRSVPHVAMIGWLGLIGVMGLPSVVAPIGRTADGLPVGVQIVTGWYQDRRAIAIARRLEALCGGYQVPPGLR
ncbi:amidase [Streptosporangium violaceochromogenes]|nr:amidase [Streptosporangium violaceochromogenes]